MSKYFVTFETTIWYLWELRLSRECPVREASPSDASGVVSRLATTINKCLALESNCETQAAFVVHYPLRHPRRKGYQRRNTSYKTKKNCQSPWFEKNLGSTAETPELPTSNLARSKDSSRRRRPSFTQYHVLYVMILPLGITAGRTRILPTIELNSLPLLIKEYCAV